MVFQKRIRVISDGRLAISMEKSNPYNNDGPYGGDCFPTIPGIGGHDWDDPDHNRRYYNKTTGGWVGGVFMSNEGAPRYLSDFGGTSEEYDNHQWSDDINS